MKDSHISWLGEIPEHWETMRLTNCVESLESGSREQTETDPSDSIPNLGGEHIGFEGQVLKRNMRYVSRSFYTKMRKGKIQKDDILLVKDGATIGKTALVERLPYPESSVNEHVFILKSAQNCISGYLYRCLRTPHVQELIWQEVTGSAQPGLNSSFVNFIFLPIPPISEQVSIVRYLDYVGKRSQRLIRAKRKLIALLAEQKETIIARTVAHGLDPSAPLGDSAIEWLGKIPKHWEVRRLRNVVEMRVSNVDKHVKSDEIFVRLCNYVDVYKNERIDQQISFMHATATPQEIERFRLKKDDVLITKDSETWDDIGVPALVTEPADDLISGYHLALLRPHCDKLSGSYLLRALQSKITSYQFHVEAKGVTRYGLSHSGIKSVWLPLPPLAEQIAICEYLDQVTADIDSTISRTNREIELLDEYRTRLIFDVVTGKVDVREAAAALPEVDPLAEEDELDDDLDITPDEEYEILEEEEA